MNAFRRFCPAIALLLALLIVGQSTDLLACADEATPSAHHDTHSDAPLVQGAHPVPAPGGDHGDAPAHDDALADCLCHVVFTSMAALPAVPPLGRSERPRAALLPARLDAAPAPIDHVPLG